MTLKHIIVIQSFQHLRLHEICICYIMNLILRQTCVVYAVQLPYRMLVKPDSSACSTTNRKQNAKWSTSHGQSRKIPNSKERLAKSVGKSTKILSYKSAIESSNQPILAISNILSSGSHSIDRVSKSGGQGACDIGRKLVNWCCCSCYSCIDRRKCITFDQIVVLPSIRQLIVECAATSSWISVV